MAASSSRVSRRSVVAKVINSTSGDTPAAALAEGLTSVAAGVCHSVVANFSLSEVEQDIVAMAARANLRLRFDKVAHRVIRTLQSSLVEIVPSEEAILFTITAPIKLPSKSILGIEDLAQGNPSGGEIRAVVHGNDVLLRRVRGVLAPLPKVVGFVHNPESNAGLLLDAAEARLTGVARTQRGEHC